MGAESLSGYDRDESLGIDHILDPWFVLFVLALGARCFGYGVFLYNAGYDADLTLGDGKSCHASRAFDSLLCT